MLQEFGRAIWIADGGEAVVAGFRYPTRMAVMRLADGGLFVWSPIQLTGALKAAVDALGPIRHVIEPNSLHHLYLPEWKRAWPQAKLHAPPGLRAKRNDIEFDADLGDVPNPDWAEQIDQVLVHGNRITTEAVFFHRPSGTVLFCDLLQQIPPHLLSGWRALVAKLDLMVGPEPQVPRKFRIAFSDKRAARKALGKILDWPAQRVLVAHGTPVENHAEEYLRRAFRWLIG
ncbi:MAG: DUF4336 domain-containing protein [Alphaproteobacteria bacterium]|nr:DUF4336 domain-containing protein [Alphaproteobacteria bacterium]MBL7097413.1 DUF4336 domain-containing protein [Alphaproteobacteria bacterium]